MKKIFFTFFVMVWIALPSFSMAETIVSLDHEDPTARKYMQFSNPEWLDVSINTNPLTKDQASLLLLYQALLNPDPKLMQVSIRHGADVNAVFHTAKEGSVPMMYIVVGEGASTEVVQFLLDAKANINARMTGNKGITLLMVAAQKNPHAGVIAALLDAGADPSVMYNGKKALDYAEQNANLTNTDALERLRKETTISSSSPRKEAIKK